jgi:hypothetical protein
MHVVSRIVSICLCLALTVQPLWSTAAQVPELPEGMVWFNAGPVKLSNLHDRFVLLHFGIYSAANADLSIHDIKALAAKYPAELAIIGIHSAKYFESGGIDDIRQAVQEQGIAYPVAVDNNLAAWKAFHVFALPTVILLSPDGEVLLRKPGSDIFKFVDGILTKQAGKYQSRFSQAKPQPIISVHSIPVVPKAGNVLDDEETPPKIDVTAENPEIPKPQFIDFDFKNFVGEQVKIGREYSRRVGTVKLSFTMPKGAQLLKTVKSYVRVFTKDGEMIGGLETPQPQVAIPIDRQLTADRLYIEAAFYYSQEGGWGSFKGLLFEVPLADYPKSENIDINYNVSNP